MFSPGCASEKPTPECSPKTLHAGEMKLTSNIPPEPKPCTITIQQPPKYIVKKRQIITEKVKYVPKIYHEKTVVPTPAIERVLREIKIPVIHYETEIIKEPKIIWVQSYITDPYVVNIPRVVIEPMEVYQTLFCQPKPQVVDVPSPVEYSVYPAGPERLNASTPCLPCSMPSSVFQLCKPHELEGSDSKPSGSLMESCLPSAFSGTKQTKPGVLGEHEPLTKETPRTRGCGQK